MDLHTAFLRARRGFREDAKLYAVAVSSLAVAFLCLATALLAITNLSAMAERWSRSGRMTVYIRDGAPDADVQALRTTLAELPEEIRTRLEKVPILIDTAASEELFADGLDPRALGLFQGTAMPDAGSAAPAVTTILLFKRSLERFATDEDHLAEEIRITVLHETAHYFGLDEEDLEKLGLD